jgi:hypothetical protein
MSPVRPVFSDGAILGAGDLTALGQLDRDRDARHARHLHTPGIAAGMELNAEKRATEGGAAYVDVALQPGYAIDGTGRELVLATPLPVSSDRFASDVPNPVMSSDDVVTVWYPVFVRGLDAPVAATNGQMGCQGGGGPSRIAEDVEIEFGRPGDATLEKKPPAPDAGPGDGDWNVLVGFVRYNPKITRFVAATATADGVRVPTAGARAGLVAGQRGRVELRPGPGTAAGAPVIVLDGEERSFVFGLRTGTGGVAPLLKIDASGNLVVTGTLGGGQTVGTVLVASGTASDGTVLPLPAGTDVHAVRSGALEVSVMVSPRYPELPRSTSGDADAARFAPAECRVDAERRVHCWGTWSPDGAHRREESAACDYLVLVSVPQGGA